MSQLNCEGPRSEMVRLRFPKVKEGEGEKAAGLIQLSIRWPTSPGVSGETPVALGRWLALNMYARLLLELCDTMSGKPEEITLTALTTQPPTARSTARFTLPRNCLLRPKGKSYEPVILKRCAASMMESPHSAGRS